MKYRGVLWFHNIEFRWIRNSKKNRIISIYSKTSVETCSLKNCLFSFEYAVGHLKSHTHSIVQHFISGSLFIFVFSFNIEIILRHLNAHMALLWSHDLLVKNCFMFHFSYIHFVSKWQWEERKKTQLRKNETKIAQKQKEGRKRNRQRDDNQKQKPNKWDPL